MINNKVICIVGPTASGKTALSVGIAKRINGEIISADSMQVYFGMPIASAAPTVEEKCGIPHHLLEFLSPEEQLTVVKYQKLAIQKIEEILKKGKTPIIVGGTGLYIESVVNNLSYKEEETNPEIRKKLEDEYDTLGKDVMYNRLLSIDKESASRISKNDKKRIVRALEIYENSNITMTKQYENSRAEKSPYDFTVIGIKYQNRQTLYDRINLRVDEMLKNGLLEEARVFYKKASAKSGGYAAIGHKEFFPYFDGEITFEEAVENLKRKTRNYAKRQLTWFNNKENVLWVYPDLSEDILEECMKIIERRNAL